MTLYPKISIFEVAAVVLDNVRRVTLLHDGNFFDDLLQVGVHRHLFDGQNLARFFVHCLENRAIGSFAKFAQDVKDLLRLPGQALLR